MRAEDLFQHRAEPHDAAAGVAIGQGELQQAVEAGFGPAVDFLGHSAPIWGHCCEMKGGSELAEAP